jgi:hypothetical protein
LLGAYPGYVHSRGRSRFNAGAVAASRSEGGFAKSIGENGVFAVDSVTGWALAVPNADAPSTQRPPLPGSADDHNRRTLEYFRAAGIPAAQISGVHVNALMQGGADASGARTGDSLKAYYSVLERSIQGVPVVESRAWARFNADDDVVEESVYWPALPASVDADLAALKAAAGTANFHSKLTAAVALDPKSGHLAIHHSSPTDHRPFAVQVTYDVDPMQHRKAKTRHFDLAGREVAIPNETDIAPKGPGRPKP